MRLKLTITVNTSIYAHIFAQSLWPNPPPLWRNETRRFTAVDQKFAAAPRKRYQDPKLVINIEQGPPVSNDNYALQYLYLQLKRPTASIAPTIAGVLTK